MPEISRKLLDNGLEQRANVFCSNLIRGQRGTPPTVPKQKKHHHIHTNAAASESMFLKYNLRGSSFLNHFFHGQISTIGTGVQVSAKSHAESGGRIPLLMLNVKLRCQRASINCIFPVCVALM